MVDHFDQAALVHYGNNIEGIYHDKTKLSAELVEIRF
ncbi:hypothetical protein IYQ_17914 [Aeromonas salmonicida subsp. salmonicida 01-B526]|uniref:Uncharacterized protein n=1 Tax=Aeromonas salmonicida subsp. salmonicida 01-B526 TaxID=1076135 RepID=A0ABP2MWY0_AERSS|nr:hypothetical protein IYQ_17914 [Aeromonas salmonicida subsp. salmonicida 01-B526]